MPAGAVWGRWQPANDVHADQVAVLRNAGALLASPAGEFLLKGRRTPAPVIRSTPLALRVPRAGIQEERLYPSVLAATYALPEGRVGRIYVNLGMSKERVQVSIPAMGMTGQRVRLTTYRAEDGEVTQDSDTQLTPALLTVMLPPMAAALVESAPAGWEVLK